MLSIQGNLNKNRQPTPDPSKAKLQAGNKEMTANNNFKKANFQSASKTDQNGGSHNIHS
jgi:hypothetical protein